MNLSDLSLSLAPPSANGVTQASQLNSLSLCFLICEMKEWKDLHRAAIVKVSLRWRAWKSWLRRRTGLQKGGPSEDGCRELLAGLWLWALGVFDMPCVVGLGCLDSFPFSQMH